MKCIECLRMKVQIREEYYSSHVIATSKTLSKSFKWKGKMKCNLQRRGVGEEEASRNFKKSKLMQTDSSNVRVASSTWVLEYLLSTSDAMLSPGACPSYKRVLSALGQQVWLPHAASSGLALVAPFIERFHSPGLCAAAESVVYNLCELPKAR